MLIDISINGEKRSTQTLRDVKLGDLFVQTDPTDGFTLKGNVYLKPMLRVWSPEDRTYIGLADAAEASWTASNLSYSYPVRILTKGEIVTLEVLQP